MITALLIGITIGLLLTFLGAGGSIIAIPAFIYLLGQTPLEATTNSLLVIAFTAGLGASQQFKNKQVNTRIAIMVFATSLAGVSLGGLLAPKIPPLWLNINYYSYGNSKCKYALQAIKAFREQSFYVGTSLYSASFSHRFKHWITHWDPRCRRGFSFNSSAFNLFSSSRKRTHRDKFTSHYFE